MNDVTQQVQAAVASVTPAVQQVVQAVVVPAAQATAQAAAPAVRQLGQQAGAGVREGAGVDDTALLVGGGLVVTLLVGLAGAAAYRGGLPRGVNAAWTAPPERIGPREDALALRLVEFLVDRGGAVGLDELTGEAKQLLAREPLSRYVEIGHLPGDAEATVALNREGQRLAREAGLKVYVHPIVEHVLGIARHPFMERV